MYICVLSLQYSFLNLLPLFDVLAFGYFGFRIKRVIISIYYISII